MTHFELFCRYPTCHVTVVVAIWWTCTSKRQKDHDSPVSVVFEIEGRRGTQHTWRSGIQVLENTFRRIKETWNSEKHDLYFLSTSGLWHGHGFGNAWLCASFPNAVNAASFRIWPARHPKLHRARTISRWTSPQITIGIEGFDFSTAHYSCTQLRLRL
jgi:hypothetical protein